MLMISFTTLIMAVLAFNHKK
ncbi:hypothetical protein [Cytobacillus kochii]